MRETLDRVIYFFTESFTYMRAVLATSMCHLRAALALE